MVLIQLRNKYGFLSLNEFELKWEVVKNGKVVGTDHMKLADVSPGDSVKLELKLPGINLRKAQKVGDEVLVNLRVNGVNQLCGRKPDTKLQPVSLKFVAKRLAGLQVVRNKKTSCWLRGNRQGIGFQ